jgi:hypothetical protein
VLAHSANLLFDEVKIVQKPLAGGRNFLVLRNRRRYKPAGFHQDNFVPGKTPQKTVAPSFRADTVLSGKFGGVLFQLFNAE